VYISRRDLNPCTSAGGRPQHRKDQQEGGLSTVKISREEGRNTVKTGREEGRNTVKTGRREA